MKRDRPLACVLGDMDLVRPLGLAGIPVAVAAPSGDPVRFSRFVRASADLPDAALAAEVLVDLAQEHRLPPVLFYENDWHVLLVSRERDRLAPALRFVVAAPELVEDLVDKERFGALAESLGLPVPHAWAARPAHEDPPVERLRFPALLKPLPARNDRWRSVEPLRKAVTVNDSRQLHNLWSRLAAVDARVLLQEFVPGPESRVESYHVYVDATGDIAAEFTGRKIRTNPPANGHSTALVVTDAPDVVGAGQELMGQLGLTGVAKADYKRGPDGRLHLLEVNPRFSLWHHLGAVAGLNLPAVVYADLAGERRPPLRQARAGTTWVLPWLDFASVRAQGGSARSWLRWAAGVDAFSIMSWDDPLPFVAGKVGCAVRRRFTSG